MKVLLTTLLGLSAVSADNVAVEEFGKANNLQFTPNVYKEVLKTHRENFLISPLSAETVLAFAQSGCKDETAQEIRNALALPDSHAKVESTFKAVLPTLTGNDLYTLQTANKMYVKDGFPIKDGFKKAAVEVYQAETENIDFTKKDEAAKSMNDWVEKQTENKIHDLISSDSLDEYTRAVLINALYFKANWSNPFKLAGTSKRDFYKTSKDVVQVDTMRNLRTRRYKYYECHNVNAKFLELPFNGEEASMTIILPNEKEGLAELETKIERVFVPHNLTEEFVNVALPKFKIESEIDFKEILTNLGVKKVFDEEQADLSGISGKKGSLVINEVKQKTFIDVSEEGVEAAAATYALIAVPQSGFSFRPKEFIADHPFIFYIKIKGLIAFAGRVTSPQQ